jgi:hypothetical protein
MGTLEFFCQRERWIKEKHFRKTANYPLLLCIQKSTLNRQESDGRGNLEMEGEERIWY